MRNSCTLEYVIFQTTHVLVHFHTMDKLEWHTFMPFNMLIDNYVVFQMRTFNKMLATCMLLLEPELLKI